jgi:photosystem II stability/assembly factor-like uncharacterized protein
MKILTATRAPSSSSICIPHVARLPSRCLIVAVLTLTLVSCAGSSGPTPSISASSSARTSPVSSSAPTPAPPSPAPTGFRPVSLTFVSATDGWGLGTGACAMSCVWIYHTTDGGATWTRTGAPPAHLPDAGCYLATMPCVNTLRFATPERGFAFGANWGDAFMTDNGGTTWSLLAVNDVTAMALAGNYALRLQAADGGCSTGECQLKRSTNGGVTWSTADQPVLTPEGLAAEVFLQPDGHAYVVGYGNPAGGGPETAELYRSSNFGATWALENDPCSNGSPGRPITVAIDSSADGVLWVDCLADEGGGQRGFVVLSTDGGTHFGPAHSSPPSFALFAAGSAAVLALATSAGLWVSHSGGLTWSETYSCPSVNQSEIGIAFVGFETPSIAHLICGSAIARSTDGGLKWATYTFPS